MQYDDDDVALAACAAIIIGCVSRRRRRPRRFWVRPSLKNGRQKYRTNDFINDLLQDEADDLNLEYRKDVGFTNYFRMNRSDFELLLGMVGPKISKENTNLREAIPASERLAVTLRFLATGDSYYYPSFFLAYFCPPRTS